MKTRSMMKVFGLMAVIGCVITYLFINFHNNSTTESNIPPKNITYDEVYSPAFERMNKLIAEQKNNKAASAFITNLEKEMLDLRITKEIHQHIPKLPTQTIPVYPLIVLWGMISSIFFMMLRSNELKERSSDNSYQKILDQLEISYSQDRMADKAGLESKEPSTIFKSEATEEI